MAARLNPYLHFTGDARQALEFYREVFGGELQLMTYGQFGAPEPAQADQIMHGMLETARGFTLMAGDTPPGMEHSSGSAVAISLSGDDAEELRGYWEKIADGGTVTVPLEKQMWGDEFGSCVDRFGISWLVNISSPA
ncbi:MAG TPA: VOC family protein [Pilimelia sp.]|nr:VOC family protein [Pilimelia sp.]